MARYFQDKGLRINRLKIVIRTHVAIFAYIVTVFNMYSLANEAPVEEQGWLEKKILKRVDKTAVLTVY